MPNSGINRSGTRSPRGGHDIERKICKVDMDNRDKQEDMDWCSDKGLWKRPNAANLSQMGDDNITTKKFIDDMQKMTADLQKVQSKVMRYLISNKQRVLVHNA